MPTLRGLALPPPEHHQEFEALCLDLLKAMKRPRGEPNLYGRNGQGQHGVDFVLELEDGLHAYQCKRVDAFTIGEFDEEVAKFAGFPLAVKTYTVLTTAENDARLQDHVLGVSATRSGRGESSVHVVFWTTLRDWLDDHREVLVGHYGEWLGLYGRQLASPIFGVPDGSQYFTGREQDIAAIAAVLTSSDVAVSAAIEGLPGVGKSEIAIQLAHQLGLAGAFPGGIFWIDAENPDLAAAWDRLGELMGLASEPTRANAAVQMVARKQAPVLLVLDNVVSWAPEPGPLPSGIHIRRLVTTQTRDLGGTRFRHHALPFLAAPAARLLFDRIAERTVPDAKALLDHLDGYTLALELAASWLRAPGTTATAYLALLQGDEDYEQQLAERGRHELTARQALTLLWNRLTPEDRTAWATVSALAPGAATAYLLDACGVDGSRRRSLARAFVLRHEGEDRWGLHRLVRAFALTRLSAQHHARAFDGAVSVLPEDINEFCSWYQSDRVHFDAILARAREVAPQTADDLMALLVNIGAARVHTGDYLGACDVLEDALRRVGSASGSVAWEARARTTIAVALRHTGDLKAAKKQLTRALSLLRKSGKAEAVTIAQARLNLGVVLRHLKDYEGARSHILAALRVLERRGDGAAVIVAAGRSNLGAIHFAQGNHQRARAEFEAALPTLVAARGAHHAHTATCRSNLGNALHSLGLNQDAERHHRSALASRLPIDGPDHPDIARYRANLAVVLMTLLRYDEAIEEALEARRGALLLPEHAPDRKAIVLSVDGMLEFASSPMAQLHRAVMAMQGRSTGAE